jgi:hypothetical protein
MGDTEYATWQKPLDDIVAKMKRLPPPPPEGSSAVWSSNGQDIRKQEAEVLF